jgi:hypothetical protein
MSELRVSADLQRCPSQTRGSIQLVGRSPRWFQRLDRGFTRLARRRRLSIAIVAISAFVISAVLALLVRFPQPGVHDEFSYLLAADTFAHGRLTNPTHPMWVHFESMHIIHQPSYASKYPPAQGLFLAAGRIVGGQPVVGVWLSAAFGCSAICWMLMGWMPARWALLGGMLAVMHPLVLGWSQGYWGGAVAMGGGALVVGAFRRLVRSPSGRNAVVMGIGMALLANSRPYEGFLLCLVLMIALLFWMRDKNSSSWRVWLRRVVTPLILVMGITGSWMAYYNWRVTGNALRMPYMVHEAEYAVAPSFVWQKARPEPAYRHKELRDFHNGWELPFYEGQRSLSGLAFWGVVKVLVVMIAMFQAVGLVIPMVTISLVAEGSRWMRVILVCCGVFIVGLLPETFTQPHYSAPILGIILLVALQSMRYLRLWRWGGIAAGGLLVFTSVALCIASFLMFCRASVTEARQLSQDWSSQRAGILERLKSDGDRHLVIVRYAPGHSAHVEWVYNEADIDGSKVVWAREMEKSENLELIKYFNNRRVWLLEADTKPPRFAPYPPQIDR